MSFHAVVVAGGSGTRLGSSARGGEGPKALRRVAGIPLVTWSVQAMAAGGAEHVVVVTPTALEPEFRKALSAVDVRTTCVAGGTERRDSVGNGLASLGADARIVLIHDAARPLVPVDVVTRVAEAVRSGSPVVVPAIPVTDSIRALSDDGNHVVDRSRLRALQTPQGFRADVLRHAHTTVQGTFTDDASLCEAAGATVTLVDGSHRSVKITHPLDFILAEALAAEG